MPPIARTRRVADTTACGQAVVCVYTRTPGARHAMRPVAVHRFPTAERVARWFHSQCTESGLYEDCITGLRRDRADSDASRRKRTADTHDKARASVCACGHENSRSDRAERRQ